MQLLHILNPRSFLMPDFQNFMLKALATDPFVWALEAFVSLSKTVAAGNPHIGLFVTMDEEGRFVGMVLVGNSQTPLAPGCTVLHFYNTGANDESRKLLIRAVEQFAKAHGKSKIRAVDINSKADAFVKLFSEVGEFTSRGQVYEIELASAEDELAPIEGDEE